MITLIGTTTCWMHARWQQHRIIVFTYKMYNYSEVFHKVTCCKNTSLIMLPLIGFVEAQPNHEDLWDGCNATAHVAQVPVAVPAAYGILCSCLAWERSACSCMSLSCSAMIVDAGGMCECGWNVSMSLCGFHSCCGSSIACALQQSWINDCENSRRSSIAKQLTWSQLNGCWTGLASVKPAHLQRVDTSMGNKSYSNQKPPEKEMCTQRKRHVLLPPRLRFEYGRRLVDETM
jgi:hypothetical protein